MPKTRKADPLTGKDKPSDAAPMLAATPPTPSREPLPGERPPSELQWDIYDLTMAEPETSFDVEAVAGSGKTTVIAGIVNRANLGTDFCAIAFSKNNARTFEQRIPTATSSTIHSLCYRTFRNQCRYLRWNGDSIDSSGDKMRGIARELKLASHYPGYEEWEVYYGLADMIHYLMVTMTPPEPEPLLAMAEKFAVRIIGDYNVMASDCAAIMARARQLAFSSSQASYINFDEMVYYPVMERMSFQRFHTVAVDEVQDLSTLQRHAVELIPFTRLIAVGDPYQAIMMFAGAENTSQQDFREHFGLRTMPLSVCYRAGKNIVQHAQKIVPHITSPDWMHDGVVTDCREGELAGLLKINSRERIPTFVICRINAPLINLCFRLIIEGLPARVRGRDTGKQLNKLLKVVMGNDTNMGNFEANLMRWREREVHKILQSNRRRPETIVGVINDKVNCLMAFYDNAQPSTLDALQRTITQLFTDDTIAGVNLLSGHASKGLEAEHVFVIRPEKLPLTYNGQTPDQIAQERHLDYVVRTRAMQKLTYVITEDAD